MNIAQITFYNTMNYGGTLQAYALNKILSEYGNCKCIDYLHAHTKAKGIKACIRKYLYRKRKKAFDEFVSRNMNISKQYKTLNEVADGFDRLVCGSDQIWNMNMIPKKCRDFYFLNFGSPDIKRIAYAASIGQNAIKEEDVPYVKECLLKFSDISLREKTCVKQISAMTSKPVSVTVDPTFLLSREQWEKISCEIESLPPYLLVYDLSATKEFTNAVNTISNMLNLPVVHFRHKGIYENELKTFFDYGPDTFLSLIRNAEFVFGSSFHGVVFSIIFEKNFYVWSSGSTNSRIADLLSMLGLSNRLLSAPDFDMNSTIEWNQVREKLTYLRNQSRDYIESCLK